MQKYNYRIKIINPGKKSDFVIREIHNSHKKFESIAELKIHLMDEFGEQVPATTDFQIGYYLGKQSAKYWLVCPDDLNSMYTSLGEKTNVFLWCDARLLTATGGKCGEVQSGGKKRKSLATSEPPTSKRKQTEDEVDETVMELKEKHGTNYTMPQM